MTSYEGASSSTGRTPDLKVAFLLMNHFTLIPVAGLVESLSSAANTFTGYRQVSSQCDWMTLDDLPVVSNSGMRVAPTRSLGDLDAYHYVVLVGGLLPEECEAPDWLAVLLQTLHLDGTPIIALSCASFVLAQAGLLDGRRCAVHLNARDAFEQQFPYSHAVVGVPFIDDGNIITCPGGTAFELADMLIGRHCEGSRVGGKHDRLEPGRKAPSDIARCEHNSSGSVPFCGNSVVERSIAFMREHLHAPGSLHTLAEAVGVNERKLHRAFLNCTRVTPAQFWRDLRLTHAKELLVNTDQLVTEIAMQTGFTDSSHFTLWFRKTFSETPCSFRKRRRDVDTVLSYGGQPALPARLS
ncbi:GlxA family transcriptional regulator [Pseudomonas putida]|uniref:GlxA family transcriptional regulator n=1 Tax=Pseudomonas putida TaxID=303 RepID=UPI003F3EF575